MHQDITFKGGSGVDTAEDVHQRGFACTVLADYGVNFSRAHLKVHIIQRPDPGKGLGDVFHFQ